MSLDEYQRRRDFSKTDEPEGKVKESPSKHIFVVQKHQARNLHYDLRLEYQGVLKSWAIPKEPPTKEGVKRLAVQTEDHPLDYAKFQGEIPEGEYGAGKVETWDNGKLEIEKYTDKEIIFNLHGKKMKGTHILIKMKPTDKFPGEKNWLLFKKKK